MNYLSAKIFFSLFFFSSCYNNKLNSNNNEIIIEYQFINYNGDVYDNTKISKIIITDEAKEYTFIKSPKIQLNLDGNKNDTTYSYFLFKNNLQFGFFIDSPTTKSFKVIKKDSFFANQLYFNLEKINSRSDINYSFLSSTQEGEVIVKKFFLKKEIDSSYSDTTLFYFNNKLNKVTFSLDKRLDSIYNSKLIKRRSLYYNKIKTSSKYGSIYREISVSFKVGDFLPKADVEKLVKLFEISSLKMAPPNF